MLLFCAVLHFECSLGGREVGDGKKNPRFEMKQSHQEQVQSVYSTHLAPPHKSPPQAICNRVLFQGLPNTSVSFPNG